MQHDHSAERVLKALSDIAHQPARWATVVFENGSAGYFADHEYLAADVAQLLRLNADQLDPESCAHTEAIALRQRVCGVCGFERRKRAWKRPERGSQWQA